LDVEFVLGYFGATPEAAQRRFNEFLLEGIGRPLTVPGTDLSGTDRRSAKHTDRKEVKLTL
jgi:hypothetical protein